jgi:hypothetical protein
MMKAVVDRLLPQLTDVEEREIARFMSGLATETLAQVPAMPGAGIVWVKAQMIRRWEAERRVERPLETMQSVHIGLGFAAAIVLLAWSAPLLLRLAGQ